MLPIRALNILFRLRLELWIFGGKNLLSDLFIGGKRRLK
jgi:hypothetical protein